MNSHGGNPKSYRLVRERHDPLATPCRGVKGHELALLRQNTDASARIVRCTRNTRLTLPDSAPFVAISCCTAAIKLSRRTHFRMPACGDACCPCTHVAAARLPQGQPIRPQAGAWKMCGRRGAWGRIRTTDTRIFNPLLYQLSYPGIQMRPGAHRRLAVYRGWILRVQAGIPLCFRSSRCLWTAGRKPPGINPRPRP